MRPLLVALAVLCVAHGLALADPPAADPIGDRLFPPDFILEHQDVLGLDEPTRKAIVAEVQTFQTTAVKLQWDLKTDGDALAKALDATKIDEAKVLALADKVMALEHDLKRAHLTLLVRLKNALTPAQQAKLRGARH
jgi:Spy/CpxP family protein refolding chaperone